MGKPKQYTASQFIEAIRNSGGIVSTIAARVGIGWRAEIARTRRWSSG